MLSSQRVKPYFIAERFITSTLKNAFESNTTTRISCHANSSSTQLQVFAKCTQNWGHPSNLALARAIRVTGGNAAAVRAAVQLRLDVCEIQQHPGPHLPARLRTDREFGDTAAIDLFVLADYAGNQLSFINVLDSASIFCVVAMIPSKHPKIVWDHFFKHWIIPFGVPRRMI